MSPNICLKRLAQVPLFVLLLHALSGCPLMMSFMMGPMLSKNMDKPTDPQVKATVEELIQEGISQLAYNRGPYKLMALGDGKVTGDVISVTKFQQIFKENLRSRGEWEVLGQQGKAKTSGETSTSVKEVPDNGMGLLNAQLYEVDDSLYLALQLLDARSNELFWSGLYSRVLPESPKESDHQEEQLSVE